jgi:ankyrin repeat protein
MFAAIRRGDLEFVEKEIKSETLNLVDSESGHTPLTLSAELGQYGILKFLLQRGADRTIPNRDHKTAYEILFDAKKTILMKLFSTY